MQKYLINGGRKLYGKVQVDTSKNALLPILASCLLIDDEVVLHNVTYYEDVLNMIKILRALGAVVQEFGNDLVINSKYIKTFTVSEELSNKLRASIFLLGPLLGRLKKARVAYPGGCAIGTRPIDIHLLGLTKLGAKIIDRHGMITAFGDNLKEASVCLPFPSVGATENLIMSSVFLKGKTTIIGGAKEPEVVDLCNFLNKAGAKIFGAGSDLITIYGVEKLHKVEYAPLYDRIVAGTYLFAPLITGGEVEIENANRQHLKSVLEVLDNNACKLKFKKNSIIVKSSRRLRGLNKIETLPYPFFPTDLQQPITALASICAGNTILVENLFENRFNHVQELIKMGANITVKDRTAFIEGVQELYGASVFAPDLRGGASLVLAGLGASGYTTISNVEIIDRGYYKLDESFARLGADITRLNS